MRPGDDVEGRRVIVTAKNGSEYIPFVCAQTMNIAKTRGILATATPDSGTDETFAYDGLAVTTINMTGITSFGDAVANSYVIFDLMGDSPELEVRIVFTNKEGFERSIDCAVLFPSAGIDKALGTLSKWNTSMQVSGRLTFNNPVVVGTNRLMISPVDTLLINSDDQFIL